MKVYVSVKDNFTFSPYFGFKYAKTHTLLFQLFRILIDLNRLVYSWLFLLLLLLFFLNSIANKFSEKKVYYGLLRFIIKVYDKEYLLMYFAYDCNKFDISMFPHIFHSFSKNCVIYSLEKIFFEIFFGFFLSFVFISMHHFSQGFWLNLKTLCTFFILIYDLMIALNFLHL